MVSTIAVDFDGVIHAYTKGWKDGRIYDDPVDGAFGAVRLLMEKYSVFVFTSRDPISVAEWMTSKGKFECILDPGSRDMSFWNLQGKLLITNRKLPALAYIDDRAIRFVSWNQVLDELDSYERKSD